MRSLAGKSYLWIFCAFLVAFILAGAGLAMLGGQLEYVVVLLPVVMGTVLALEIRSGVVLDS